MVGRKLMKQNVTKITIFFLTYMYFNNVLKRLNFRVSVLGCLSLKSTMLFGICLFPLPPDHLSKILPETENIQVVSIKIFFQKSFLK